LFGDAAQEGADREGRTIWQHVENRVVPHNLTVGGAFDSDRVVRRLSIHNEQTAPGQKGSVFSCSIGEVARDVGEEVCLAVDVEADFTVV